MDEQPRPEIPSDERQRTERMEGLRHAQVMGDVPDPDVSEATLGQERPMGARVRSRRDPRSASLSVSQSDSASAGSGTGSMVRSQESGVRSQDGFGFNFHQHLR